MDRCRFVQPEMVKLSLGNGHWIEIKRELTAGEQRRMFAKMVRDYAPDGRALLDPEQVGYAKVCTYLLDWDLTGQDGKAVPISDSAIDNLDVPMYEEIRRAIETHEAAIDQAHAKNENGGESKPAAISPSAK